MMEADPYTFRVSLGAYVDLVRATVADPYERLRLLFNVGLRGRDLR